MALISPDSIDSVVAIGVEVSGKKKWIATGFLFGKLDTVTKDNFNTYKVYLITNRHVIEGLDNAIIRFNSKTNVKVKDYNIKTKNLTGETIWVGHPNLKVDVMVTSFDFLKVKSEGMKSNFFMSDKNTLTKTQMKTKNISEGDFVYTLGYPMGLIKKDGQHIFVRSGIVSRIQDLYETKSLDFVIDAFVFPGNSGGPVLTKPEFISIKGTKPNKFSKLIGLVKSYIPYEEEAISVQTGKTRIIFEENTGLTLVEPVDHIIETIQEWERLNLVTPESK